MSPLPSICTSGSSSRSSSPPPLPSPTLLPASLPSPPPFSSTRRSFPARRPQLPDRSQNSSAASQRPYLGVDENRGPVPRPRLRTYSSFNDVARPTRPVLKHQPFSCPMPLESSINSPTTPTSSIPPTSPRRSHGRSPSTPTYSPRLGIHFSRPGSPPPSASRSSTPPPPVPSLPRRLHRRTPSSPTAMDLRRAGSPPPSPRSSSRPPPVPPLPRTVLEAVKRSATRVRPGDLVPSVTTRAVRASRKAPVLFCAAPSSTSSPASSPLPSPAPSPQPSPPRAVARAPISVHISEIVHSYSPDAKGWDFRPVPVSGGADLPPDGDSEDADAPDVGYFCRSPTSTTAKRSAPLVWQAVSACSTVGSAMGMKLTGTGRKARVAAA